MLHRSGKLAPSAAVSDLLPSMALHVVRELASCSWQGLPPKRVQCLLADVPPPPPDYVAANLARAGTPARRHAGTHARTH